MPAAAAQPSLPCLPRVDKKQRVAGTDLCEGCPEPGPGSARLLMELASTVQNISVARHS